ncbi:MAG: hypothetical protein ACRDRT_15210, partial [Pseudonocardiaceae bacterium]
MPSQQLAWPQLPGPPQAQQERAPWPSREPAAAAQLQAALAVVVALAPKAQQRSAQEGSAPLEARALPRALFAPEL